MTDAFLTMLTSATYTVFLRNLLFSGGLGSTEVLRAAQRNSEIFLSAALVSVFSTLAAVLCRLVAAPLQIFEYALLAALYGAVLLVLYLVTCVGIVLLPHKIGKYKRLLLKRMGMSVLNTLVMGVPLLAHNMGESLPGTIGMGLGAGIAFLIVTLLINSGLHILQQNKAIPPMFTGVPAALIYTGLLALAFTGFKGQILFQ